MSDVFVINAVMGLFKLTKGSRELMTKMVKTDPEPTAVATSAQVADIEKLIKEAVELVFQPTMDKDAVGNLLGSMIHDILKRPSK